MNARASKRPWLWAPALLAACLLLAAGAARAQERLPEPDAAAIRRVIEAQLAAFRRDDGPAAFAHADPDIQIQLKTPEAFMRMVREGYRPVYRHRQVIFEELFLRNGRWVQPLVVTGPDGHVVIALYTMLRQPDASWRVGGVVLLPSAAQGV